MSGHSIWWTDGGGRLKTYSVQKKAGRPAVVKVEIEVSDPHELGCLVASIEKVQRDQAASPAAAGPGAKKRPEKHPARPASLEHRSVPMLTYRGDPGGRP